MEHIIQYFDEVHPQSDKCKTYLRKVMKYRELKKREILIQAGDLCEGVYIVDTGLLRGYENKPNGEEVTSSFMPEGDLVGGILSTHEKTRSIQTIQALEDSTLYYIWHEELQYMYANFPEFNTAAKILMSRYALFLEMRLYVLATMDGPGKYKWFQETFPGLVLRTTIHDQASYLGMKDTSLSRIRGKR